MMALLNESQVADLLGLTARQVMKLARCGELPSVRLPGDEIRFDPEDIWEWVESRKLPANGEGASE